MQELCPESEFYGDAYDRFGLFGRDNKTVMAHCVHFDEKEIKRMKENGVFSEKKMLRFCSAPSGARF